MLVNTVKNFLMNEKLASSSILVAFSGGLDSLSLLYSLYLLSKEFDLNLCACHINHQWRAEESTKDEEFVKLTCEKLNIKFFLERLEEGLPKKEVIARELRYQKLIDICIANNISVLLTAHTRSDQIETVLYRLIKGTGTNGLCGIPYKRLLKQNLYVYRPLLDLNRSDIEVFANQNNLKAREDSSNKDIKYLRNRVRHNLLPELRTYNSKVDDSIIRLSKISNQNEEIINYFLDEIYNKIKIDNINLDIKSFNLVPEFIKPRIVIKFLEANNIKYDFKMIENILQQIKLATPSHAGIYYSLIKDFSIFINNKYIRITTKQNITIYESNYNIAVPGNTYHKELNVNLNILNFTHEHLDSYIFPKSSESIAYVDLSKINSNLVLRTRRPGDTINPIGMNGKMKLKKYLINHHIPKNIKDSTLVIAMDNEILWVVGVGLSDKIKVINSPTHILKITRG